MNDARFKKASRRVSREMQAGFYNNGLRCCCDVISLLFDKLEHGRRVEFTMFASLSMI